ncbi:lysozyme-like protein, partial [Pseudovirgaria hyperparasitica]
PQINKASLDLLIHKEGRMPSIYRDQLGAETIGVGHRCIEPACLEVSRQFSIPLSPADMEALLRQDLHKFEHNVSMNLADVDLNANQYGVVVSVAFNGGEMAPQLLEFYKAIKAAPSGNFASIFSQDLLGHDLGVADVAMRRKEELVLFKTPTDERALP